MKLNCLLPIDCQHLTFPTSLLLICNTCGDKEKQISCTHKNLNNLGTNQPLEQLHIDLIGTTKMQSIGGKWYIIFIVDDFSRFIWCAFLLEKVNTVNHFVEYFQIQPRGEFYTHQFNPKSSK